MNKYINKEKKEVWIGKQSNKPIQRKDGVIEINPSSLSSIEINEKFDFYKYEEEKLEEGEYFTSQMLFDEKNGICKPKKLKHSEKELKIIQKSLNDEQTIEGVSREIIEKMTLKMLRDNGYIE